MGLQIIQNNITLANTTPYAALKIVTSAIYVKRTWRYHFHFIIIFLSLSLSLSRSVFNLHRSSSVSYAALLESYHRSFFAPNT